jgi:hypothetical protein
MFMIFLPKAPCYSPPLLNGEPEMIVYPEPRLLSGSKMRQKEPVV